mmetsp:Transcript_35800/g.74463  ORF Transcript_35800/g.74463 Transcript_35800/m.74463 type:complete len:129 (-) Transcript_35800:324-710(-)
MTIKKYTIKRRDNRKTENNNKKEKTKTKQESRQECIVSTTSHPKQTSTIKPKKNIRSSYNHRKTFHYHFHCIMIVVFHRTCAIVRNGKQFGWSVGERSNATRYSSRRLFSHFSGCAAMTTGSPAYIVS